MTATDIIRHIETLPAAEQAKVRDWIQEHEFEESPEMLAALDRAAQSADERGTTPVADVRKRLPTWISKSETPGRGKRRDGNAGTGSNPNVCGFRYRQERDTIRLTHEIHEISG